MSDILALALTVAAGAVVLAGYMLMVWAVWCRVANWLWWHSWPVDAWIERILEVPPEQRRFS